MKEKYMPHLKKIGIPVLIAILSIFVLGSVFSSPKTYRGTMSFLDKKEATVVTLTASATTAAFLVSAIPNDTGNPIAEKIADLSDYLIGISAAILIEKYLPAAGGFIAFRFLVPLALLLWILSCYAVENKDALRHVMVKVLIFALVIWAVAPCSTFISRTIENTFHYSVDEEVRKMSETTDKLGTMLGEDSGDGEAAEETEAETETETDTEERSFFGKMADNVANAGKAVTDTASDIADKAGKVFTELPEIVGDTVNQFKEILNSMINYIAVLLVTACVIPIFTLFFLIWLCNMLLGTNVHFKRPDLARRGAGRVRGRFGKKKAAGPGASE